MKKKIKLRDLSKEQWDENKGIECDKCKCCDNCKFGYINCDSSEDKNSWINHKEMYSDKFLNQEIEIDIPDILDEKEKEYLRTALKLCDSTKELTFEKIEFDYKGKKIGYIKIGFFSNLVNYGEDAFNTPAFNSSEKFREMAERKVYTMEDLGL